MFNDELKESKGKANRFSVPKIQYYGNASFNDSYIPLPQDRLYYYQRLTAAKNQQDINTVQEEIKDRYGRPGPGTINLYKITEIRTTYTQTLVKNILIEKDRIVLTLMDDDTEKKVNKTPVSSLIEALEEAGTKHMFKQLKKDSLVLEFFLDVDKDPLAVLMRNAELFYYDNKNP
jgi:transcription-repair coupling factor (superfamily II helicase)